MHRLVVLIAALICLAFPTGIAYGACNSTATVDQELDQGIPVLVVDADGKPLGCGRLVPRRGAATRQYDPSTGRFTSRDPMEDVTGQPYAYAYNNPLVYTDPSGMIGIPFVDTGYELEFNPMDGVNAAVNIGRGATGGLTDDIADAISPGASSTVSQHTGQQLIGGMAVAVPSFGAGFGASAFSNARNLNAARAAAGAGIGMGVGAVATSGYDCLTGGATSGVGKPRSDAAMVNRQQECMNSGIGIGLIAAPWLRPWAGRGGAGSTGAGVNTRPQLLGPGTSIGSHITPEMAKRGWTERLINSTIGNPSRTVPTRDTRHLPGGAGQMDDPATAYYSRRGGYVVRNDRTGDVVQISDRTDAGWIAPWD